MHIDYFSGIQPSAQKMHLGNYFGSIKSAIELAKSGKRCLFFAADIHSCTVAGNPEQRKKGILAVVATYMALGLPEETPIFKQSDVPDVGILSFLLGCNIGTGFMDRGHAFKDKVANRITPCEGLRQYPLLMSGDILMYFPKYINVGADQGAHVEIAAQCARSFNDTYGDTFTIPETYYSETPKVVGTDGAKMSKSYNNQIDIFASGDELKKQLKKIITDSRPLEESKSPDFPLAQLLYLFLSKEDQSIITGRLLAGTIGYGELKKTLAEKIEERFGSAREHYIYLTETPEGLDEIKERLAKGKEFASNIARKTMHAVYERIGCSI